MADSNSRSAVEGSATDHSLGDQCKQSLHLSGLMSSTCADPSLSDRQRKPGSDLAGLTGASDRDKYPEAGHYREPTCGFRNPGNGGSYRAKF